jgi:phosphatidylserine decarboxylase
MLVSAALVVAVVLHIGVSSLLTTLLLAIIVPVWLLVIYFFRDPNRKIHGEPDIVLGPGDGEVIEIVTGREEIYLQAEAVRISMFLSVLDVHVQRVPVSGSVREIDHQPGRFLQAFRPEASDVNEHIAMVLDSDYGPILVKQIAGILARRCVNTLRPGDVVERGQRFGLIRFGSRIDLFLPIDARIMVKVGDKVTGGVTAVARLKVIGAS